MSDENSAKRIEEITKRLNDCLCVHRHGGEPWRAQVYGEPPLQIHYVEYGPDTDKSDCYDLFEDPSPEVVEFVAHSKADIQWLLEELNKRDST
jgi:hypothetical protein